jgi:ribonuclease Z
LLSLQAGDISLYLIGTGGPELTPDRQGPSTLIEANGEYLLFDAGRSALDGIYSARVPPGKVTRIFLTHLHNDHIEGLPTLWITPWFLLGRQKRLEVWGPPGTAAMIDGMRRMYAHDLEHRSNAIFKREYLDIEVQESAGGVVYSGHGIQVTAIPVEHRDGNPALGYRVEAAGRSVLMTGDATLTGALLNAGRGFDVVISNVAAGSVPIEKSGIIEPILDKLMRPEQAARLFTTTAPRLAVFSHIVKKGLPGAAGDAAILARTRKAGYSGALRMGLDGMKITVDDTIRIEPPQPRTTLPDLDGQGKTQAQLIPAHNLTNAVSVND